MADGAATCNMEKARDGEIWKGPRSQVLDHEFSLWEEICKIRAAFQSWILWKNYGLSKSRVILSAKVSYMLILC